MARGRNRLSVGPSSAYTAAMRRSSPTSSWLCSALATADSSSFAQSFAAARGVKARMARASATSLPRMWSQTSRALRADVRTYLAWARTSTPTGASRLRRRDGAGAGTARALGLRRRGSLLRSLGGGLGGLHGLRGGGRLGRGLDGLVGGGGRAGGLLVGALDLVVGRVLL